MHLKVDIQTKNKREAALDMEFLAQLIREGHTRGVNWSLEGEEDLGQFN